VKPRQVLLSLIERLSGSSKMRKEAATLAQMEYLLQRRKLLEELQIDLVLDVGANIGQFAAALRRTYAGEILSFEPVAAPYDKLSAASAADGRWKAQRLALGRRSEEQTIHVSSKTVFNSFLKATPYSEQRFPGMAAQVAEERVSVRRLDELLPELVPDWQQRRIFLKMDTQGYDLEVFAGLGRAESSILAIQTEVSLIPIYQGMPHWTEAIAAYERGGFAVAGLYPVNYEGAAVIEFDCLMVKRQAR
jgi:FkbM family methyltransferase